jgi:uncharacterized protein (DUF885 family)
MREEYLPHARRDLAASAICRTVRRFTARRSALHHPGPDAREIHARGLAEVARIRGEMEAILEELAFDGTWPSSSSSCARIRSSTRRRRMS